MCSRLPPPTSLSFLPAAARPVRSHLLSSRSPGPSLSRVPVAAGRGAGPSGSSLLAQSAKVVAAHAAGIGDVLLGVPLHLAAGLPGEAASVLQVGWAPATIERDAGLGTSGAQGRMQACV